MGISIEKTNLDLVYDADFLKQLDEDSNKEYTVRVLVLDKEERPLRCIESRITAGSISVNGSSSVRRSGSITFVANEADNDLIGLDMLLAISNKIKILIGFKNNIDTKHDDYIWFNQGIFVITQPSFTHGINNVTINLQFKDKMCLLNGECGGTLPTSITFDTYEQELIEKRVTSLPDHPNLNYIYAITIGELFMSWQDANAFSWGELNSKTWGELLTKSSDEIIYLQYFAETGWTQVSKPEPGQFSQIKQRIFDIIQTLVCNFGYESFDKIIINDVPLEINQIVRFVGTGSLYYNDADGKYQLTPPTGMDGDKWEIYNYNEECGHVYTDFTYPGTLVSAIGDSVCSVLDKIVQQLGNYEYFYDIDGNFVFQEKKNYLNNQYQPMRSKNRAGEQETLSSNGFLLDDENYFVDFSHYSESIYTFEEGNPLVTNFNNNPKYQDVKNDFHVWGKNNNSNVLHYHVVIKQKPILREDETYIVKCEVDAAGNFTGRVCLTDDTIPIIENNIDSNFNDDSVNTLAKYTTFVDEDGQKFVVYNNQNIGSNAISFSDNGELIINNRGGGDVYIVNYRPKDWRAIIYMRALEKQKHEIRPDIYEQELLDLFDSIYDMKQNKFKDEIVNYPTKIPYWIDFIEPGDDLADISVDVLGPRIYTHQNDLIKKMFDVEIPEYIMIDSSWIDIQKNTVRAKCSAIGQSYSLVPHNVYSNISIGLNGLTAWDVARDLLYQHIQVASAITLTIIPIYYLEPNHRIKAYDALSDIHGDYVVNSISVPLDPKNTMSISASKVLNRM